MKHIKKALSYSIAGGVGLSVIAALQGCGDQAPPPQDASGFGALDGSGQEQNLFLVIEQTGADPNTYKLLEKHPTTGPTRAILQTEDGSERFLSEAELKTIAEEEAARVEAGTSRLTQETGMQAGGLSLGETILAAAAGSLIGGMLANRLMSNRGFQQAQRNYGGGRPTAAISQPYRPNTANKQARSGFFGGSSSNKSSSGRSSWSFGG